MKEKLRLFAPLFLVLLLTDCTTKELVETHLAVPYIPHEVVGDVVRFTLAYNPGAAMGMSVGEHSRVFFTVVGLGIMAMLGWLLVQASPAHRLKVVALGLVMGGAAGNLYDRLRSPHGVVDFIDIGVGATRFYTFNVADIGVFCGAILLAWALWREDAEREAALAIGERTG
jgi:signal peptidase II